MPDSIREQVLAAFAARLSAERSMEIDRDSELPSRSLWDFDETAEVTKYGKRRMTLPVICGAMEIVDAAAFTSESAQGNDMLARIQNDALNADPALGGLAKDVIYKDSTISYPTDGQQEIVVTVTFELIYETSNRDPYSQ